MYFGAANGHIIRCGVSASARRVARHIIISTVSYEIKAVFCLANEMKGRRKFTVFLTYQHYIGQLVVSYRRRSLIA